MTGCPAGTLLNFKFNRFDIFWPAETHINWSDGTVQHGSRSASSSILLFLKNLADQVVNLKKNYSGAGAFGGFSIVNAITSPMTASTRT